ncbi:MAG: hypothetical protein B7733_22150 [Myxococcales bacterium FL481]|nr:MAG: hypothetical protein B7733_22150 [Myxococcales bacterium FL481]
MLYPYAEANMAYYDPSEVTTEEMLANVQAVDCPQAAYEHTTAHEVGEIRVQPQSITTVPGDLLLIDVQVPAGHAKTEFTVSPPWSLGHEQSSWTLGSGTNVVPIRIPADAVPEKTEPDVVTVELRTEQGSIGSADLEIWVFKYKGSG